MVFDLALDSNHCKNGKRHVAHGSKKCLFAIPMYFEFSLYVYSLYSNISADGHIIFIMIYHT